MSPNKSAKIEQRPEILYKYRAATDRTVEMIATKSIWLSRPTDLNDPLECRTGKMDSKETRAIIRKMEEAAVLGLLARRQIYSLTPEATARWINSIRQKTHRKKYEAVRNIANRHGVRLSSPEKIIRDFQKRISATGILSLTEDPQNELMWAHYADEHRGLVLGFSCGKETPLGGSNTIPVTYSNDSRASIANGFQQKSSLSFSTSGQQVWKSQIPFESDLFRTVVSTKPASWEYEKEWRYIESTHGLRSWPAPLVSVTFGVRMKAAAREKYRAHIRSSVGDSVNFYVMRVSRENELERHRIN